MLCEKQKYIWSQYTNQMVQEILLGLQEHTLIVEQSRSGQVGIKLWILRPCSKQ